jgi:hypothetical protein
MPGGMAHEEEAITASDTNVAGKSVAMARIGLKTAANFISGNFQFDMKNRVESNNGGLSLQSLALRWRGWNGLLEKNDF